MKLADRLDLAVGIVLGLVLGLVLAYLVVFEIGGGNSGSGVSTETTTKSVPAGKGAASPPGQRR